jgi:hypothetical protein
LELSEKKYEDDGENRITRSFIIQLFARYCLGDEMDWA